ncbi:DUF885 domain-containing protein [Hyphobacterium marinum]|uniref:DUF885 domain-containing protein n=1 Tax=Hyphobacterium marinum TaxID=3116574 RepID=A0ABU7M031_9PROT|nr:DUF885 domain-containing protein [Hyphobacterium sp. Y6023]MEE2566897.1 DUF885 domain-containing protein [Hyphobacterium sp. Y6023]
MRVFLLSVSAAALLAACGPANNDAVDAATDQPATGQTAAAADTTSNAAEAEATETDRLMALFEERFQRELAFSPITQTTLGLTDDLEAYGQWDDPSRAAFEASVERTRNDLARLRSDFDYDALTESAQVSYRFFEFVLENQIEQAEFWDHNYIYTQFFGPHSGLPSILIGYHRVADADQAEAYVSRLNGLGDAIRISVEQADERARNGVLPPEFAYPVVINTARGMITGAPFDDSGTDSPLWSDFQAKVASLDLPEDDANALLDAARTALLDSVGPAYETLIETMETHAEWARQIEIDGVSRLPRGEAYYASQLANYTTRNDVTAQEIHDIGLAEVDRIHGEMREIMAEVGFEGTVQDFFVHLRESDEFYYSNDVAGRERYLAEATAMIDRMRDVLPDYFGHLPQAAMEVRAVEDYRIETATGAFYEPGPLDGSEPGAYYVNLSDMRELPVYQMETLAYHEGLPGHHMQIAISQELDDVPMFQRTTWYSAYGEGWALYTENLGKDMGFFTDPYQDFGRLGYEVFRAARLVVDTGIHALDWSEQDAIDYMMENTPMTEGDITNEVRRYIVWPGQAVSYKMGMLTILDLRQRAMDALGDDFDYGEFHDVVLGNGSVPLSLLSDMVDDYIEEASAAE